MATYAEALARRAERAFGTGPLPDIRNRTRAIVGGDFGAEAARALEALRAGEDPLPRELAALEMSLRQFRPALLITPEGEMPELPTQHPEVPREFPCWSGFMAEVSPRLASVGRIDSVFDGTPRPRGTAFLVAPNLVITNRHVLEDISYGSFALSEGMAVIRFRYEYGGSPQQGPVPLIGVRRVSPTHDLALLEVPTQTGRPPLALADRGARDDEAVVVVGFPSEKSDRNPLFVDLLFGQALGVKRASPGRLLGRTEETLTHDCSTLGGSSGSPVFALEDASVLGVHSAGRFAWRNDAIPAHVAAALLNDGGAP